MTVVMPGAQSLVSAILTDSWSQARTALSRLWARRRPEDLSPDPSPAALERAKEELDLAKEQAVAVAGEGSELERTERMTIFWAGYLAGQVAARAELAAAIRAIPGLLEPPPEASISKASNTISGTVHGNVVQADNISGGIKFGR